MGTEIVLEIGEFILDWSKNMMGVNHGILYVETDRKHCRTNPDELPKCELDENDLVSDDIGFRRPLKSLVTRLELMGYTIDHVRKQYEYHATEWLANLSEYDEDKDLPTLLNFDEFISWIRNNSIQSLDETYLENAADLHHALESRFPKELVEKIPYATHGDRDDGYSERSHFGHLIGFLSPYDLLRILAECPDNSELEVIWEYGPLVKNGWAKESQFNPGLSRSQTFLIATEGSSDAHILKHALTFLRPEVADFFHFIDVTESHPFPGTGNLIKFADGLVKIDIQNNIIFLFDNDTEGYEAYEKTMSLRLPSNMRAMVLPDINEFTQFSTKGPEGISLANINGRAAAIECYLDLNLRDYPAPQVIWTNYKKDLDRYHGALEHKESYAKNFLKMDPNKIIDGSYDTRKLELVLDAIISKATEIAELKAQIQTARY